MIGPPVFRITLKMQVHGCFATASSLDVWLQRSCALPFPPFRGLNLTLGKDAFEIPDDACIVWDTNEGAFTVYCAEDKELYEAGLKSPTGIFSPTPGARPIDAIVAEYLVVGWERAE